MSHVVKPQLESNKTTMSEEDIRPKDIMKNQHAAMMADIEYILKYKPDFIHVSCPGCLSNDSHVAFQKYTLDYHECNSCKTTFINPRPTETQLTDFYINSENYAYWNKYIFPATDDVRREKIFAPRAQQVKEICDKFNFNPKTMLEVGAGFGTFCEEIKKLDFLKTIIGIEPTPGLANTCREKGITVIESSIEKAELSDLKIDLLCAFEVLEHLFSPDDFISKCSEIITEGGFVILTNPNGKGFDAVVSPEHAGVVDVEHLNYMNPESMRILFERHGFEIIEIITPGKLDADLVRTMFLEDKITRDQNPFLYQILVEQWETQGQAFQDFLAKNNLSTHMWTIARKLN